MRFPRRTGYDDVCLEGVRARVSLRHNTVCAFPTRTVGRNRIAYDHHLIVSRALVERTNRARSVRLRSRSVTDRERASTKNKRSDRPRRTSVHRVCCARDNVRPPVVHPLKRFDFLLPAYINLRAIRVLRYRVLVAISSRTRCELRIESNVPRIF
jgi:hypothetical protein